MHSFFSSFSVSFCLIFAFSVYFFSISLLFVYHHHPFFDQNFGSRFFYLFVFLKLFTSRFFSCPKSFPFLRSSVAVVRKFFCEVISPFFFSISLSKEVHVAQDRQEFFSQSIEMEEQVWEGACWPNWIISLSLSFSFLLKKENSCIEVKTFWLRWRHSLSETQKTRVRVFVLAILSCYHCLVLPWGVGIEGSNRVKLVLNVYRGIYLVIRLLLCHLDMKWNN